MFLLLSALLACSGGDAASPVVDLDTPVDDSPSDTAQPADTGTDTAVDDTADSGGPEQRLADGWLSELSVVGGCDDTWIFVRNADDTVAIVTQAYNLARAAHSVGGTYTQSYVLPSQSFTFDVYVGQRVSSGVCVPAGEEGVRVLDATYEPTSGTAEVTVTPVGEPTEDGAYPADAVLTLSEVTLVDLGDPTQVGSISTLEIRAHIGEPP